MSRPELQNAVDLIITSPPYNTSRVGASDKYSSRYDKYEDKMSDQDYCDWTVKIFEGYDKVLKKDGCVLYNLSYSSENTQLIWIVISEIIKRTNFTTADVIVWKKSNAIPNNVSKNKLTRIVEYIFVFSRKSELKTFEANKKITGRIERTGQANYENIYNFIEARNNDGSNPLNKATFSTELIKQLMKIYAKPGSLVYDNFIGIGTTAKACLEMGMNYVGSEISEAQVNYFIEWKQNFEKNIKVIETQSN
jgi:site-specific DNA-methyltransferase (adenine-specific)